MPKSRIRAKIQKVSDIAACFSEKVRKKMNKPKPTQQDERMNVKNICKRLRVYTIVL